MKKIALLKERADKQTRINKMHEDRHKRGIPFNMPDFKEIETRILVINDELEALDIEIRHSQN